jgi:MFS family permease
MEKKSKSPRYFYGWNIVLAGFLSHLAYAEQYSSTLGLFMRPLQNEFGWSRSQIALVQTISRVLEALVAPFIGPILDRFGTRSIMPIGSIIAGIAVLATTQVNEIWQFYITRGVIAAIGFSMMGHLVTSIAINNWFIKKRGRALAIVNIGSTLSNVILMPTSVWVIAKWGWRSMFATFAVITWIVVLIPSLILMRRRPEDMGLYPDGENPAATSEENQSSFIKEAIWTRKEAFQTSAFWLISLSFAVASFAFQGINISMAPYMQDLNYSDGFVAGALFFRASIMTIGLPFMGLLAEKSQYAIVRIVPFVLQGTGSFLLILGENPYFLFLGLAIYGLGVTSIGVTQEVIWANYFGRYSLGRIRSAGFLATFGAGATGPVFMNLVYDFSNSYKPALTLFLLFFLAASILIVFATPPQAKNFTTVENI